MWVSVQHVPDARQPPCDRCKARSTWPPREVGVGEEQPLTVEVLPSELVEPFPLDHPAAALLEAAGRALKVPGGGPTRDGTTRTSATPGKAADAREQPPGKTRRPDAYTKKRKVRRTKVGTRMTSAQPQ